MKRKFRGDNRCGLIAAGIDGTLRVMVTGRSFRALTRWKKKRIRQIERTTRSLRKMGSIMCDLKVEDEMHLYRSAMPLVLIPPRDVKV